MVNKMSRLTEYVKQIRRYWQVTLSVILLTLTLTLLVYDVNTRDQPVEANPELIRERRSIQSQHGNNGGSVVYTRWGRSECSLNAQLVYAGFAAGAHYTHVGGGANTLCMTDTPEWGTYNDAIQQSATLYGAEYAVAANNLPFKGDNIHDGIVHDNDIPCAVCKRSVDEGVSLMIPGRMTCSDGWNKEYTGYLMGSATSHKRSEWICVDEAPEGIEGGDASIDGNLFYPVSGICGSLPCPPYVNKREITCVVCTK